MTREVEITGTLNVKCSWNSRRSERIVGEVILVQLHLASNSIGQGEGLINPDPNIREAQGTTKLARVVQGMERWDLSRDTEVGSQDCEGKSNGWESLPAPGNAQKIWTLGNEDNCKGMCY